MRRRRARGVQAGLDEAYRIGGRLRAGMRAAPWAAVAIGKGRVPVNVVGVSYGE